VTVCFIVRQTFYRLLQIYYCCYYDYNYDCCHHLLFLFNWQKFQGVARKTKPLRFTEAGFLISSAGCMPNQQCQNTEQKIAVL